MATRQGNKNSPAEKDSGNESEPELSSFEFSKLKISPKPLHPRPKPTASSKTSPSYRQRCDRSTLVQPSISRALSYVSNSEDGESSEVTGGKLRLPLSARCKHIAIESAISRDRGLGHHELNNNDIAASASRSLTCRSYQLDKQSDDSAISRDDFYETDDEIQQITSQPSGQGQTASRSSSRQSGNKRKRTNTLSADLEVESLLESGAESTCSYDATSLSDFSETENPVNELPRKRHCSGALEECRPFLDLEKMQDQVEARLHGMSNGGVRRSLSSIKCQRSSPTSRGLESPLHFGSNVGSRDLYFSSTFCPLTSVEQSTIC